MPYPIDLAVVGNKVKVRLRSGPKEGYIAEGELPLPLKFDRAFKDQARALAVALEADMTAKSANDEAVAMAKELNQERGF